MPLGLILHYPLISQRKLRRDIHEQLTSCGYLSIPDKHCLVISKFFSQILEKLSGNALFLTLPRVCLYL